MPGQMKFQFELGGHAFCGQRQDTARRILILADCSGQKIRDVKLADRKIQPIDVDNFDATMARMAPQLRISPDDAPRAEILIEFRHLDDFHPDSLFQRLPVFDQLRQMRKRLENPATFQAAAEEIKHGMLRTPGEPAGATEQGSTPLPVPDAETEAAGGSLFEQLLGEKSTSAEPAASSQQDAVHRLISRVVEPYLAKSADPVEQRQLLFVIDDVLAELMRRILHHPAFQGLESVWRGIHWLVSRIEDSETLKIFLLDASATELAADLAAAGGKAEQTAVHRILGESSIGTPGGEPWSLIVGTYTFGANEESLDVLESLGAISAGCGGFFVGAAHARLMGCDSLATQPDASNWTKPSGEMAERWQTLRRSPHGKSIALAFPRFMLRLPYGEKSEPTERFRFEEIPSTPSHEIYLWGNPALACAAVLARAWAREEEIGSINEIDDLPYHVYHDDSGQTMKPCAEAYLNEKTANAILECGITPLLSVRQRNCVLLPRLMAVSWALPE